jgi:putative transcriptional regulator
MPGERLDNQLKVFRARHDLTQADLAERVGVTRKTINTIENGRFVPSTVLALKIARVFGVALEELFHLE